MITNYNKHWLRDLVYDLKKNHTTLIIWKRFVSSATNLKTGVTNSQYQSSKVKAILYPEKIVRVDHPVSQFPYGAVKTKGDRTLIIDQKDLPSTWLDTFQETDRILVGDRIFEIRDHDNFEGSSLWVLTVVNVKGTPNIGINLIASTDNRVFSIGDSVVVEKV